MEILARLTYIIVPIYYIYDQLRLITNTENKPMKQIVFTSLIINPGGLGVATFLFNAVSNAFYYSEQFNLESPLDALSMILWDEIIAFSILVALIGLVIGLISVVLVYIYIWGPKGIDSIF